MFTSSLNYVSMQAEKWQPTKGIDTYVSQLFIGYFQGYLYTVCVSLGPSVQF